MDRPTSAGPGTAEPDATGPDATGPEPTGPEPTGPDTTEPAGSTPTQSSQAPVEVAFRWDASPIPEAVRRRMTGITMRPGCPVGFDDLAYVRLTHWNFDGKVTDGELVVAATEAQALRSVFEQLFNQRFPIRRMTLIDDFGLDDNPAQGADDFASIEADNTSAFNCRLRTGSKSVYSEHSYGTALDLNPLENPYVGSNGGTSHPASRPFLDRSLMAPGVIGAGSTVVKAFSAVGWQWGGTWTSPIDYQHFSRSGH